MFGFWNTIKRDRAQGPAPAPPPPHPWNGRRGRLPTAVVPRLARFEGFIYIFIYFGYYRPAFLWVFFLQTDFRWVVPTPRYIPPTEEKNRFLHLSID